MMRGLPFRKVRCEISSNVCGRPIGSCHIDYLRKVGDAEALEADEITRLPGLLA